MPGERDFVRSRRENFDGSPSERGRERSETSRLWRDPNDNGTPRGFDALSARASTARRAEEEETPRKTDPRTSRRRSARARARVFGNDRFGWKNPSRPIRSGRRVEEHTRVRVRSARKTVFDSSITGVTTIAGRRNASADRRQTVACARVYPGSSVIIIIRRRNRIIGETIMKT